MTRIYDQLAAPLTDFRSVEGANGLPTIRQVAEDLHVLFSHEDNNDLERDFPGSVQAYRRSVDEIEERLIDKQDRMFLEPERVQSYIPLIDAEGEDWYDNGVRRLHAVGSSALTVVQDAPEHPEVKPDSPNVSLVICHPYRGMGLGTMLLKRMLQAVETDFEGRAWTAVHQDNFHSQATVTKAGFWPRAEGSRNNLPVIIYTYQPEPSA